MEDMNKVAMQDTDLELEIDPTDSKKRWLEEFMEYLKGDTVKELKGTYKPEPEATPEAPMEGEEGLEGLESVEGLAAVDPAAPVEGAAPEGDEAALEGLDEETLKALLGG